MQYSKEEKARLLAGWEESGKSISAYVKEQGLVRWTFTRWLKEAREPEAASGFVEVAARTVAPVMTVREIVIEKGDMRLRLPLDIRCNELRTVVEALGAVI